MGELRVSDVMTVDVVALDPEDSLHEAIQRLASNGISGAPVVRDGKVLGVLSESDVLVELETGAPVSKTFTWFDAVSLIVAARYPHKIASRKVADAMTVPAVTIKGDAQIWRAASLMHRVRVKRLPVVDENGDLTGIVSRADLVGAMAGDDSQIRLNVIEALGVLGDEVFEELEVEVEDGVATLEGCADRRSTHDIAVRMTSRTPGVTQVRDRLEFDLDDARISVAAGGGRPDPRRNWNEFE